ncbi:MAG: YraN family protein [Patescibacteria group bacterium]|nr:YraN family protein [Patescibacteria group bacterium]
MKPKKIGDFGEKIAQKYLESKGYKILDRNYSRKWMSGLQKGEIDIVAKPCRDIFKAFLRRKDNIIHFIEVKTLSFNKHKGFFPEDKVNFQKQRQIKRIAQDWLLERNIPLDSKWQIDVVSVIVNINTKKAKIRHFKNITSS